MGTLTLTVLGLIASFAVQLITTVQGQGQQLAVIQSQMLGLQAQVGKVENKLDTLPFAKIDLHEQQIKDLKEQQAKLWERLNGTRP